MRNLHAAQHERAAFRQRVHVVTNAGENDLSHIIRGESNNLTDSLLCEPLAALGNFGDAPAGSDDRKFVRRVGPGRHHHAPTRVADHEHPGVHVPDAHPGFDVRVASDGAQALTKLAEGPSDLVLTDIEMPTMDGFALTFKPSAPSAT